MISRNYRAKDLIGLKCRVADGDVILNGAGQAVTKNTVCVITDARYGVDIKTEPCPCCGQYCVIKRIKRERLTLIDE